MICVATWNVEWAAAGTERGSRIQSVIQELNADIFVLTEGSRELLPPGNVVDGGTDWGYEVKDATRRKVLIWSRFALREVGSSLQGDAPPGRFVAATADTPMGDVRILGVCIPWRDAHVRSGRRDRKPWEDHSLFLSALRTAVEQEPKPMVVAGDFNQRIPKGNQPLVVATQLSECFDALQIPTGMVIDRPLIDHIAISKDLQSENLLVIPDHDSKGYLTDHRGAVVTIGPSN